MRKQDKLGNLLTILVQTIQLAAGIGDNILDTKIPWVNWVDQTWLTYLQRGLWDINGAILTDIKGYKMPRQNDKFLMDIFNAKGYNKKKMNSLNRCRIHLRVITLSDIATYDGKKLSNNIRNLGNDKPSAWEWPLQIWPNKQDRNTWSKALKSLISTDGSLYEPLGQWQGKTHQIWKYMTTSDRSNLLRFEDGTQKSMIRLINGRFIKIGRHCVEYKMGIPIMCVPTVIGYKEVQNEWQYSIPVTRRRIFCHKEKSVHRLLEHVVCKDINKMKNSWKTGQEWLIGTDGGLKNNIGTIGVSIKEKSSDNELLTIQSAETCNHHHLHSTREELRAQLAAETIIHDCGEYWGREKSPKIDLVCDSSSTLKKLKKKKKHTYMKTLIRLRET